MIYNEYIRFYNIENMQIKENNMNVTSNNITDFLDTVEYKRLSDINTLLKMFEEATNLKPKVWGSIVGFGKLHYKYASGREGFMPIIGFANRKQALTLYLSYTISDNPHLSKLGKHKVSKSCLYITKLDNVDLSILKKIIDESIDEVLNMNYERIE